MADAKLSVTFAGPLVTIQDRGRPGNMRYGVAASGPMDRLAFEAAHAALGNQAGMSAIEISLGGLMLNCKEGTVTVAITGGDFAVEHKGQKTASWVILTLRKGENLTIRAGKSGSWAYLAFAGALQSDTWLGSQATHSTSAFGGGALRAGRSLTISDAELREDRLGAVLKPDFTNTGAVRTVIGPQDQHFSKDALALFASEPFDLSDAYDRMGMRLNGPALEMHAALSIPSEPIIRGAIQVSGDGAPTVLMADHQTTGGYPKIATVISCDTDSLAQLRAGASLRFKPITAVQAIDEVRRFADLKARYLEQISVARGSLEQRLMRENLIHGFTY